MPWMGSHALLGSCCLDLLAGCGSSVHNPVTGRAERSVVTEADEVLADYGQLDNPRLQA